MSSPNFVGLNPRFVKVAVGTQGLNIVALRCASHCKRQDVIVLERNIHLLARVATMLLLDQNAFFDSQWNPSLRAYG